MAPDGDVTAIRRRFSLLCDRVATAVPQPRSAGGAGADRAGAEQNERERPRHVELLADDGMRASARRLYERSAADDLRFSVATDTEGHGYARIELVYDAEIDD
ncbi:hypothetical protein [Halegenticoccus soli]|uniref:hypothetical protein n=1 Tax=Halegenticoccus soli TaxID=1985678 RepID=UPI00117BA9E0|nr:hypothetical protein [Halegenticoccus soli]